MEQKFSLLLGAIGGDIIGSVYEWNRTKEKAFPLFVSDSDFTDDTVMTIAVADALVNKKSYKDSLLEWGNRYPRRGYGGLFHHWLAAEDPQPYNSFGNGSAMRVSAVGFACNSLEEVLDESRKSAEPTHNHPEGIKGAQATAVAIYLARTGKTKEEIRQYVIKHFGYDLNRTLTQIRPTYAFNEICQDTVPEAIIAFLESTDYEDAVRNAVSLGGDSDTLACITGGIAAAYYKTIPDEIVAEVIKRLPEEMTAVVRSIQSRELQS